ncbi:MAG: peptidase T [Lachnospiraceae bacterium]|jgi:tripeptide aminopeptidase
MKSLEERFLKYVQIDTQSEEGHDSVPSTEKQKNLARELVKELKELGLDDAAMDGHGYVYATLPANDDKPGVPAIGFLAHMDTAPDCSGTNVKPRLIEKYDGGDIVLNENGMTLSPDTTPELRRVVGQDLIVTDGTTLLGGDDKAGIAAIMTMLDDLYDHPELHHGKVCVCFTPDEEVGNGPKYFDVKKFGADYAYTLDGGELGEVNYETFNAASLKVTVHGVQTHPGDAKDRMKNAIKIAEEFDAMLPANEVPEKTKDREGFFHLMEFSGTVPEAKMSYIIRDHDSVIFGHRKLMVRKCAEELNKKYGEGTVEITLRDSYRNMAEVLRRHMHLINTACEVMKELGVEPNITAVRGGTDGSQISFMGLPCPNLCDGDYCEHSLKEFVSVDQMKTCAKIALHILLAYFENPERCRG